MFRYYGNDYDEKEGACMKDIIIAHRMIGDNCPPFIVAEISGNHNQSLRRALKIVDEAARAGVHALKIQTYTADTMTLNIRKKGFLIKDKASLWKGMSLYQLYQRAHTPWQWHEKIFKRCKDLGLIGFSTPFDATAVDFLESLGVPCYKIASFENVDIPLIRKVVATAKPVIISSGMASSKEMKESVCTARDAGCKDIIVLKCTSSYPASNDESNLRSIPHMREIYKCHIGLSDHTLGLGAAVASIAFGACLIEKHFTLSRKDKGVDAAFSLEPGEMKSLVIETKRAWQSLGEVTRGPTKEEKKMLVFRRSIYAVKNIKAGDVFTQENVRIVRPGYGLPPKYYFNLIGRKARKDLTKGIPLSWDLVI